MADDRYKIDKTSVNNTIDDKRIATQQLEESNREIPSTFSEMLAPARNAAKQDKTDAVKMQKYYALTDALRSLGNMGGAVVGGAIGGNVLDSAPAVAEYKPNRGYLDAIEKAKSANDRLRKLDEQEFQLRYQKSQKDADRAWQAKQTADNRAWQAKMQEAERNWNIKFFDYKSKIEQAIANKKFEESAKLQKEMAADAQRYKMELQSLINAGNLAEKKVGAQIAADQYNRYNVTPIWFDDGSFMEIPDKDYESIKQSFIGKTINGKYITKDNVEQFMRANPGIVGRYQRSGTKDDKPKSDHNNSEFVEKQHNDTTGTGSSDSDLEAFLEQFK